MSVGNRRKNNSVGLLFFPTGFIAHLPEQQTDECTQVEGICVEKSKDEMEVFMKINIDGQYGTSFD